MQETAGDVSLIPWSGRSPGEGNGNPLQYSCLEKSHGQRSLAGYSPCVAKSWTRLGTSAAGPHLTGAFQDLPFRGWLVSRGLVS